MFLLLLAFNVIARASEPIDGATKQIWIASSLRSSQ
jgi:hypothetical protein